MEHAVLGVDGAFPVLILAWVLPLAGAIVLWAFGPRLKSLAGPLGSTIVAVAFLAIASLWSGAVAIMPADRAFTSISNGVSGAVASYASGGGSGATVAGIHQTLVTWAPGFTFGLLLDRLSLVWVLVITGIGFLIHVYSMGYMRGDDAFARFFAYLNFFVFAMMTLVLSDNFAGLLIGWGLVGLASYFLIGFYFERPSAVKASRKAFVINVVGDVGILFAIFLIVATVGGIGYGDAFANVAKFSPGLLFAVCACIFVGCAAKSAQVPLHTWLPDAMEGPTPVSALIHAATMVTAGVYLIARCAPLWDHSPNAQMLVGTIGGITALAGALLGIAQWDIKRILAYSTMSQIGYMIMGVGVGAYDAGVLHFLTHAFFKAQLFLTAGIVIHALADEQDIRKMGGLRTKQPFAFWSMTIGVLAICGIFPLSGYWSKDAIIYGMLEHGHPWLYAVGVITAGLTSFYMFRLLFVTFFGSYRGAVDPSALGIRHPELSGQPPESTHVEEHHGDHPTSNLMNVPVAILAVGAVFVGFLWIAGWREFFKPVFAGAVEGRTPAISELASSLLVLAVVLIGIGVAYVRYAAPKALRDAIERLRIETVRMPAPLANAFYFDAAIDALVVKPAQALGRLADEVLDPQIIDGAVRETSILAVWTGHLFRSFQTGLVRAYALTLVFGVACFVAYYAFVGGAR
jgi:NADH-quinone oxidoreductase subunit L